MKPLTFQPFCLCSTVPAPQNTQRQPFSNSLRTPLLRSLPWSPPEIATPSSTTTPDLHPATQGPLGPTGWARAHCGSQSEPARDSDTLGCQLEVKGKWLAGRVWERPGLGVGVGGVWNMDANLSAFRRKSAHHPGWHTSEAGGLESLCWALQSNPLVVQEGKLRPRKERTGPGSSS